MARKHIMINDDESAAKLEYIMESRFLSKISDTLKTLINEEYERLKKEESFLQAKASAAASLDLQNSGGTDRTEAGEEDGSEQFPQSDLESDEEFVPVKKQTIDPNNPFA